MLLKDSRDSISEIETFVSGTKITSGARRASRKPPRPQPIFGDRRAYCCAVSTNRNRTENGLPTID